MPLLLATANRHKSSEFAALLRPLRIEATDLSSHPGLAQIEETGDSFEENSALKAVAAATATGLPALADDSGLEAAALANAPGVRSARFAGPDADDPANRRKLLEDLTAAAATTPDARRARFRCVLTLALPDGTIAGRWDGAIAGHIINAERGQGGFGYDPLFIPDGHQLTFAEIPAAEKNRLSHRARATAAFLEDIRARPDLLESLQSG